MYHEKVYNNYYWVSKIALSNITSNDSSINTPFLSTAKLELLYGDVKMYSIIKYEQKFRPYVLLYRELFT